MGYSYTNDNISYISVVARYKSNGLPDSSFGINGSVLTIGPDVYLQSDQKMVAQGNGTDAENNTVGLLTRLKPNGSVDSSFGENGLTTTRVFFGYNFLYNGVISGSNILFAGTLADPLSSGVLAEYQLGSMVSIASPANVIVPTDQGVCAAEIGEIDPILESNEPTIFQMKGATVKTGSGSASGSTFNKGETVVSYSLAKDTAVSSSFIVTVEDREAPKIGNIGKQMKLITQDSRLINLELGYELSDNCGSANALLSITEMGNNDKVSDSWQIINDHRALLSLSSHSRESADRTYRIRIQATDAAGNSSFKEDTVMIPQNLTETGLELEISALPNPSRDHFSLQIHSNSQHPVTLELFNTIGSRVQILNHAMPGETVEFGQSLISGVYFLKTTQNGRIKIIKIIKM